MNMRTITFNELRKIKDSLPSGSMHRIADELGLNVDTVRNFFGGHNFKEGKRKESKEGSQLLRNNWDFLFVL